jgi:hypothetical protein
VTLRSRTRSQWPPGGGSDHPVCDGRVRQISGGRIEVVGVANDAAVCPTTELVVKLGLRTLGSMARNRRRHFRRRDAQSNEQERRSLLGWIPRHTH